MQGEQKAGQQGKLQKKKCKPIVYCYFVRNNYN